MTTPQAIQQPIRAAGAGPQLSAEHNPADRARILLRVALAGVQLPFEVSDAALQRATVILAQYRALDAKAAAERERPEPMPIPESADGAG
jgi:hypothetical protein